MSDNMRLGVILGIFVLIGAGIFTVFSGDDTNTGTEVSKSDKNTPTESMPDFDYANEGDSSDSDASLDDDEMMSDDEDAIEDEQDDNDDDKDIQSVAVKKGPGKITGVITMHDGSALPPDVVISLHYIPEQAETDPSIDTLLHTQEPNEKGEYTFEDLPIGMYALWGHAEGHTATEDQRIYEHRLEREADLIMHPMGIISGIVQDTEGNPVTGAHISLAGYKYQDPDKDFRRIHRSRSRASTIAADEAGRFTIGNLQIDTPAIQYRLLAKADGYPIKVTDLLDIGSTDVVIVMTPGSTVSGTVINATSDEPIPKVDLALNGGYAMGNQKTTSLEDGTFVFENVAEGEMVIKHEDEKLVAIDQSNAITTVDDEDLTDVEIRLHTGAMVAGRVYDKTTNKGIPGVEISASPENIPNTEYRTVKTDTGGDFLVEGLHAGSYRIRYRDLKGYPSRRSWEDQKNVSLTLGRKAAGIDFPLEQGMTISGVVVDPEGNPVEGLRLEGNDHRNRYDNQTSDDRGRFTLAGFKTDSTVTIKGRQSEYAVKPFKVEIENTNVIDVRIEVQQGAKISGVIVDTRGNPKEDARIFTYLKNDYGPNTRSKSDGTFTLEGLSEGTIEIKPVINRSWDSSRKSLASLPVKAGEHIEDVRLVWDIEEGNMSISGRVTDDRGEALQDVRIYAHTRRGGGSNEARTDEHGDYEITGLMEEVYYINFNKRGYNQGNLQDIEAGTTNADIELKRTGTISGQILQASNNESISDFKILLLNQGRNYQPYMEREFKAYNHEEGLFEIKGVHPGDATLMVRADGFAVTEHVVQGIEAADTVENVIIELETGATLRGTVTDLSGNPVSGAEIYTGRLPVQWERDRANKVSTNASGSYKLEGLATGTQTFVAYKSGFPSDSVEVDIAEGENTVDFVLREGATVEGYVLLDGKPVPDANIYCSVDNHNEQAKTADNGFYQLKGMNAGQGHLNAGFRTESGEYRNMSTTMTTETGMVTEFNFEFKLANSSVEGYIKVAEDKTAAGSVSLQVKSGETTEGRHTEVKVDGYFLFEGVPAGEVTLNAYVSGMQNRKASTGTVGNNEVLRLDIELYGGSTVYLTAQNIPQNHQTYFMMVKGQVALLDTFDEVTLRNLGQNAVYSGQIQADGTGTMSMIDPGEYTVILGAYKMVNGRPEWESMLLTSAPVKVEKDKEHNVNLSF